VLLLLLDSALLLLLASALLLLLASVLAPAWQCGWALGPRVWRWLCPGCRRSTRTCTH